MCRLIKKIANEKGINPDHADFIYQFVSQYLVKKIPALSQVVEDVFENATEHVLQENIYKAINKIQEEQWKERFANCQMPEKNYSIAIHGGRELF